MHDGHRGVTGVDALPPVARPPRVAWVGPGVGGPAEVRAGPTPPGSKYYTLRYVLVAALAEGESVVRGPALSDDTAVLVGALRALGADATWERDGADPSGDWALRVRGVGGRPRLAAGGRIAAGNAGAVLRLLLGIGALLPDVTFETDHPESLGRRPNADLLAALAALGVGIEASGMDGLLPIRLRGGAVRGGPVTVSGARSSQYLSALLVLAPLLPDGLDVTVTDGLRSAPLVRATLRVLAEAGIAANADPDLRRIRVPGGQAYRAGKYIVPGDGPTAAALVAAALALRAPLRMTGLRTEDEDVRALLAALGALGFPPPDASGTLVVPAGLTPHGAHIDGEGCIDSVPALVAAATLAEGETTIDDVATLRLKESDRIGDLCAELTRAGCDVEGHDDRIVVRGRPEGYAGGVTVAGHDDHRLVQALAIVATRCRAGLTITGADAVAKSYPSFFDDLARLGAAVEVREASGPRKDTAS